MNIAVFIQKILCFLGIFCFVVKLKEDLILEGIYDQLQMAVHHAALISAEAAVSVILDENRARGKRAVFFKQREKGAALRF